VIQDLKQYLTLWFRYVFAAFDEKGLSCLRVNGFGVSSSSSSSSSSDMECVLQLAQAAALHAQPILRMQRDLLSQTPHNQPASPDSFAPSLFASVSGASLEALLAATPPLPPRDLYVQLVSAILVSSLFAQQSLQICPAALPARGVCQDCTTPNQKILSFSLLGQVSQMEASGGGSSGRALFDDVIAGVTLQQLQVGGVLFWLDSLHDLRARRCPL
jgi:hypothetical protein